MDSHSRGRELGEYEASRMHFTCGVGVCGWLEQRVVSTAGLRARQFVCEYLAHKVETPCSLHVQWIYTEQTRGMAGLGVSYWVPPTTVCVCVCVCHVYSGDDTLAALGVSGEGCVVEEQKVTVVDDTWVEPRPLDGAARQAWKLVAVERGTHGVSTVTIPHHIHHTTPSQQQDALWSHNGQHGAIDKHGIKCVHQFLHAL